jgi:hypothetical protein
MADAFSRRSSLSLSKDQLPVIHMTEWRLGHAQKELILRLRLPAPLRMTTA